MTFHITRSLVLTKALLRDSPLVGICETHYSAQNSLVVLTPRINSVEEDASM